MTNERKIVITESELRTLVSEMVKQTLADMLQVTPLTHATSTPEWAITQEAWQFLSLRSAEALRRKLRAGWFDYGVHYRHTNGDPDSLKPEYEFHIENCRNRLAEKLSKRRGQRRSA
jgi:hypothetical protein